MDTKIYLAWGRGIVFSTTEKSEKLISQFTSGNTLHMGLKQYLICAWPWGTGTIVPLIWHSCVQEMICLSGTSAAWLKYNRKKKKNLSWIEMCPLPIGINCANQQFSKWWHIMLVGCGRTSAVKQSKYHRERAGNEWMSTPRVSAVNETDLLYMFCMLQWREQVREKTLIVVCRSTKVSSLLP